MLIYREAGAIRAASGCHQHQLAWVLIFCATAVKWVTLQAVCLSMEDEQASVAQRSGLQWTALAAPRTSWMGQNQCRINAGQSAHVAWGQ